MRRKREVLANLSEETKELVASLITHMTVDWRDLDPDLCVNGHPLHVAECQRYRAATEAARERLEAAEDKEFADSVVAMINAYLASPSWEVFDAAARVTIELWDDNQCGQLPSGW